MNNNAAPAAPASAPADQNADKSSDLPQTGSELPLLAMLGLGSLGTGFFSRRRKK
jgi:LPXTG-motif cell wall-anchored protein